MFRKLGSGKLFTFELGMSPSPADLTSDARSAKATRGPVFFWLCGVCSLTFTLEIDVAGQIVLHHIKPPCLVALDCECTIPDSNV